VAWVREAEATVELQVASAAVECTERSHRQKAGYVHRNRQTQST